MNNKTKIITKIIIGILGFALVGGSMLMNNYNNANNSIKNSNASNNSYDFYSKFGTTTTLSKEYFTKSLKAETKLTKIKIDSLPLHSTLNLDNNPIQVAQEINFDDVTKITFKTQISKFIFISSINNFCPILLLRFSRHLERSERSVIQFCLIA